ncbi:MAG: beta-galactosidase GalB [Luteolibacter sp.]
MKHLLPLLLALSSILASARETIPFNVEWKFARFGLMPEGGEKPEPEGMEKSSFDDSTWRTLNLPHDWGIEGPFRKDLENRTGKLPWAGIGWYRKTFDSPASDEGKRIFIEFDGSMSGNTIWVNGGYVGEWPFGYSSFRLEITNHLKIGTENTISVRVDNKPDSSRWYPGGGIYRHVRLVKVNPTHIAHWGVFASTPEVSEKSATVEIRTELVAAESNVKVTHEISEESSEEILATGTGTLSSIELPNPKIWDLESPHIYKVKTTISRDGEALDEKTTTFGIRTILFNTEGFFLNGKKTLLHGVCMHHDLGPLGAAVNLRAMERQIEILKSFGVNAIRSAHNPPDPAYLDFCDRMGVLVQVEAFDVWRIGKLENDYSSIFGAWHRRDLEAMVRRDRNHPSVIMWSTGNEILEQDDMRHASMVRMLEQIVRDIDPTRPVTFGASKPEAAVNGFAALSEVMGINYKPHLYGEIREKFPDVPLYASETTSSISSRGEYFFPVSENQNEGNGGSFQVSDYGLYASPNGYPADTEFEAQDKHPFVIGEFVWTGFDYIGEPTPYNKDKTNLLNYADPAERERVKKEMKALGNSIPPRSSYFGIVDLCGFPKDRFYLYQSRWRPELPMAHILPHWNWPERAGEITPVHVYTSGDEAELFLNGKSQGSKKKAQYQYRLRWDDVVYEAGELKVIAYKDGKQWAEQTISTTSDPATISLEPDRSEIAADGSDLSFVTVRIADETGTTVPRTHNPVKYSLTGPGEILAIGNGDPTDLTTFSSHERDVFNGLALVIIRSKAGEAGTIELTANSIDLPTQSVSIQSR